MLTCVFYHVLNVTPAAQKDLALPAPEPWQELHTFDAIQMLKCPSPETTVLVLFRAVELTR